jgi:precorrin-6x reductase
MDKQIAFKQFSDWYESCLESGIEPEEVVSMMGGMALVTNEELVERLQIDGEIPSY